MHDTYKGESPAKKLQRFVYWDHVSGLLQGERFRAGKHLVLASREAGDVSCLLALGVPAKNIVAVDVCEGALEATRRRFPDVRTHCGDVFLLPKGLRKQLRSAYLDFCGPANAELIKKCGRFASEFLEHNGVFGMTLLMGREKDDAYRTVLKEKPYSLLFYEWARVQKQAHPNDPKLLTTVNIVVSEARRIGWVAAVTTFFAVIEQPITEALMDRLFKKVGGVFGVRAELLSEALLGAAMHHGCILWPQGAYGYRSETTSSRGVPMYSLIGTLERPTPRPDAAKLRKMVDKRVTRDPLEALCPQRMRVVRNEDVKAAALEHLDEGFSTATVAGVLNLPIGTVRAWKAHRTMGKYESLVYAPDEVRKKLRGCTLKDLRLGGEVCPEQFE